MSTSWICDDSTTRGGDCRLFFNLFWYRHIKQVKIGKFVESSTSLLVSQSYESEHRCNARRVCFRCQPQSVNHALMREWLTLPDIILHLDQNPGIR